MYVADGFAVGVTKAMRAAGTNKPYGKAYTRLYGEWLKARPWANRYDKGTRSNLLWCVDHRSEIEAWRDTLGQNEREKLNHPTGFRRKYEAAHRKAESPDEPKKETAKDGLLRELDEARAKLKDMEAERDEVRAAYGANEGVIEDTLSALLRKDAETIAGAIIRQLVGDGRADLLRAVHVVIGKAIVEHMPKAIANPAQKPKPAKAKKQAAAEKAGGFAPGVKEHVVREAGKGDKSKPKTAKVPKRAAE